MAYRLRYDQGFMEQLTALPGDVRSIARRAVLDLAETPRPTRAKELDEHRGYYRLWLPRDHRLVWQVLDADEIVDLLYVGPKQPDLYQQLGLGRQTM